MVQPSPPAGSGGKWPWDIISEHGCGWEPAVVIVWYLCFTCCIRMISNGGMEYLLSTNSFEPSSLIRNLLHTQLSFEKQ
jgi:hypothetical protein